MNTLQTVLPRSFFARSTSVVARDLLGCIIVRTVGRHHMTAMIVEVEAYGYLQDPASHTYRGKNERNKAMFGPVGHAYIYRSYGLHWCFNVVAHDARDIAGGVLIRAVQPLEGIEYMMQLRNMGMRHELTNGPGKLTEALGITINEYQIDLTVMGPLYLLKGVDIHPDNIIATSRIGISKATEKLWRFYIADNKWVSKMKKN